MTIDDLDFAFALATEFTRRDGLILTGLRQGTAVLDVDGDFNLLVRLRGYTLVPGVQLTGMVRFKERETEANLRISGDRRATGAWCWTSGTGRARSAAARSTGTCRSRSVMEPIELTST